MGYNHPKMNTKAFMNGPLDKWRDLQLFDSSSKNEVDTLVGFYFLSYILIHEKIVLYILKVSKYQKQFTMSSILPKNKQNHYPEEKALSIVTFI